MYKAIMYDTKSRLTPHQRELIYQTIDRLGVKLINGVTPAKFFKDSTVEFQLQNGKERTTGYVSFVHTVCIFENHGKRRIGVAQLGLRYAIEGEKSHKMYFEDWNDQTGQDISLVRAVKQYMADTSFPTKVDEMSNLEIFLTQNINPILEINYEN